MKAIRILVAGALATGAAVVAVSLPLATAGAAPQSTDGAATTTAPAAGPYGGHHGHHGWGLAHLYSKLGLSADQQASVKSILTAAGPGLKSLHQQMRANSLKLRQTTPDDPNYASVANEVSQTHGALSTQLVAQMADVRSQLYAILTPAQKTQLAALQAQQQANGQRQWHRGPEAQGAAPAATGAQ
ncbi:MAG: Spy/CpxP family protein refolding chaperone [Steroidobacteraceae bacterium]|jgi:Spy/CpxP family protein refolding chaperone